MDTNFDTEFLAIMRRYEAEGTVFQCPTRGARYSISEVDEFGCTVNSLDTNEPARVSADMFKDCLEKVNKNGGQYRFKDLNADEAVRTTVLQALPFGLSADKKTILALPKTQKVCEVFCDIARNLRTGIVDGEPRLYKPVMLACVIEALENGELKENRIELDWIAPKFLEKMKKFHVEVSSDKAATSFFSLTGDLFWMLCYYDTNNVLHSRTARSNLIKERVRHAIIKDTYWKMLQHPEHRRRVLNALAETWWPDKYLSYPGSCHFWWVNQGKTYQTERKGEFVWAPKQSSNGRTFFHWKNVHKVKQGDIIVHYANGMVRAVSLARSDGYESVKPASLVAGDWQEDGWRADVSYHELTSPIPIVDIGQEIAKLELPRGPINKGGKINPGYLFCLNNEAANIILSKIPSEEVSAEIRAQLEQFYIHERSGSYMSETDVLAHVYDWISAQGFVLSKADLINFYCCLRAKPFVILAGISGTGKTKFVRLFAEAVGATEENFRFHLIPVRPDWNDNSELMGFFDLNNQYQPGALIPLLIRAHADPDKPYFLCLDEMNLARVEHYFSDFLSVIESRRFVEQNGQKTVVTDRMLTREQLQKMNTYALDSEVISALGYLMDNFPNGLGLPENVYVIGTVNMDETTHPFSRKVLDRANTIEFSEIDLTSGFTDPHERIDIRELDLNNDVFCPRYLTMKDFLEDDVDSPKEVAERLQKLNSILSKAGCQVGYRIRDEAAIYIKYVSEFGGDELNPETGFERVVLQKILPRIQGSSYQIRTGLEDLLAEFLPESRELSFDEEDYILKMQTLIQDKSPLVKKIGNMLIQFMEDGFTSFWSN